MKPLLEVLYWDNHLVVVDKPAGLPTVPDSSGAESLFDRVRTWVQTEFGKPGRAFLGVVHRLDRPVSGVVVFARTSKAAARLSESFKSRTALKIYWGVGQGKPRVTEGVLDQWLLKDETKNRVRIVSGPREGAKRAITGWKVLETRGDATLYEFEPQTGRPHQLRVCAAALGTPLLGDLKYGARAALPDRSVALHARTLEIEHPTRGERLHFESQPPPTATWDFEARTRS